MCGCKPSAGEAAHGGAGGGGGGSEPAPLACIQALSDFANVSHLLPRCAVTTIFEAHGHQSRPLAVR
jgi:hypothetical protein